MRKIVCAIALCTLLFTGSPAGAALVFSQGFETDTSGWFTEPEYINGLYLQYGAMGRVASGTGSIPSSSGSYHAVMTGGVNGFSGGSFGPYTEFGGYSYVWPGGFTSSVDVYLNTSWNLGTGFDYMVAVNQAGGGESNPPLVQTFFNVMKDASTGKLLVAAMNQTTLQPRDDLGSKPHYEVGASGWYTFQQVFYNAGGFLAVDLKLLNADGTAVFTQTTDFNQLYPIETVGGNRYGLFAFINIEDGIAVDNSKLEVVPIPPAAWLLGSGLLGLVALRRRFKK